MTISLAKEKSHAGSSLSQQLAHRGLEAVQVDGLGDQARVFLERGAVFDRVLRRGGAEEDNLDVALPLAGLLVKERVFLRRQVEVADDQSGSQLAHQV